MKKKQLKLDVKKSTLRHLDEAALRTARGAGGYVQGTVRPSTNASAPSQKTANTSGTC